MIDGYDLSLLDDAGIALYLWMQERYERSESVLELRLTTWTIKGYAEKHNPGNISSNPLYKIREDMCRRFEEERMASKRTKAKFDHPGFYENFII